MCVAGIGERPVTDCWNASALLRTSLAFATFLFVSFGTLSAPFDLNAEDPFRGGNVVERGILGLSSGILSGPDRGGVKTPNKTLVSECPDRYLYT